MVVQPLTDEPETRFAPGAVVHLDDWTPLTVASYTPTDRHPLVSFVGLEDREMVEALRGGNLLIPGSERRRLDEGEFWPDDLVGLGVEDPAGIGIGVVADLRLGDGQDRLVVDTPRGELLVPFVSALVPVVDLEQRKVVLDLPPGFTE